LQAVRRHLRRPGVPILPPLDHRRRERTLPPEAQPHSFGPVATAVATTARPSASASGRSPVRRRPSAGRTVAGGEQREGLRAVSSRIRNAVAAQLLGSRRTPPAPRAAACTHLGKPAQQDRKPVLRPRGHAIAQKSGDRSPAAPEAGRRRPRLENLPVNAAGLDVVHAAGCKAPRAGFRHRDSRSRYRGTMARAGRGDRGRGEQTGSSPECSVRIGSRPESRPAPRRPRRASRTWDFPAGVGVDGKPAPHTRRAARRAHGSSAERRRRGSWPFPMSSTSHGAVIAHARRISSRCVAMPPLGAGNLPPGEL